MHFAKLLNPDNVGACHFVDKDLNPIVRDLTIEKITSEKPPAGGKPKGCFFFKEIREEHKKEGEYSDPKKCFLASGEIKKIMRTLRTGDSEKWIGTVLSITAKEKKLKGAPVMGMVVVKINGKECN